MHKRKFHVVRFNVEKRREESKIAKIVETFIYYLDGNVSMDGIKLKQGYFTGRDFQIIQEILSGPLSVSSLVKKIGISNKSLWNRLNWLEKRNFIFRYREGRQILIYPTIAAILLSIVTKTIHSHNHAGNDNEKEDTDNIEIEENKITFLFQDGLKNTFPLEYVAIGDLLQNPVLSSRIKRVGINKQWLVVRKNK